VLGKLAQLLAFVAASAFAVAEEEEEEEEEVGV